MKSAVGLLPFDHRLGPVGGEQGLFDLLETGAVQLGRGKAQRQSLEVGADLDDLAHRGRVERGDPHAAARFADQQSLGAEKLEGFAGRDVACLEFLRDMVLPQRRAGGEDPRNDSLPQNARNTLGNSLGHECYLDNL